MTPGAMTALRNACAARGQRSVGGALGYSQTVLSLVLRGAYVHKTDRIEARVRAVLATEVAQAETAAAQAEPDWLQALRAESTRTTQALAGERVGVSEATVSQVLSGNYKAATTRIERRVRGALMGATVQCPVMWDVSTKLCQDVQERPARLPFGNPQHMRAWHACRGTGPFVNAGPCPHFNCGGKPAAKEQA